jgi:hypothetical protein
MFDLLLFACHGTLLPWTYKYRGESVVDDLEFHKSILMAILIAPKELLGAGTTWAEVSHFC